MNIKFTIGLIILLLVIPITNSAVDVVDTSTSDDGVIIKSPVVINYSLIPTVNSSNWWDNLNTPADILGSQINNNLGWISSYTETDSKAYNGTLRLTNNHTFNGDVFVSGDMNVSTAFKVKNGTNFTAVIDIGLGEPIGVPFYGYEAFDVYGNLLSGIGSLDLTDILGSPARINANFLFYDINNPAFQNAYVISEYNSTAKLTGDSIVGFSTEDGLFTGSYGTDYGSKYNLNISVFHPDGNRFVVNGANGNIFSLGNCDITGDITGEHIFVNGATNYLTMRPELYAGRIQNPATPTFVEYGSYAGYSMPESVPADNEDLYFREHIPGRRTDGSNFTLYLDVAVIEGQTVGNNFTFNFTYSNTNMAGGVLPSTFRTLAITQTILEGRNSTYSVYRLEFPLDNTGMNNGDLFGGHIWRMEGVGTDITGEVILIDAYLTYLVDKVYKSVSI